MGIPTRKDYWPDILKLADNQGKIESPERKTLEEYLGKKLNLSKPTILSLLAKWEKEGKIRLEKEGLTRKLVRLQILSIKEDLKRTVILVDWENLHHNLFPGRKEGLTYQFVSQGFLELTRQISQEIGEIALILAFAPTHLVFLWEKTFWEQRRIPMISCPKVLDKKGEEKDTTDEILMDTGMKLINNMKLSHLCVASGDKDFIPLYEAAILKGLKIVIIPASTSSLAPELIELSDRIILFPSIETKAE